jgi:membrane protease YdiL (CAAX protease family)
MTIAPDYSDFSLSLGTFTLGYLIYLFLGKSFTFQKWITKGCSTLEISSRKIYSDRMLGFTFMGIIPTMTLFVLGTNPENYYDLISVGNGKICLISIGLAGVVILVNFVNARKPENLKLYPQIRDRHWSISVLLISSLTWLLYLLGYEFVLRGVILQSSIEILGNWNAIILNLCFYALIHVPKGSKETFGSIPFGLILCLLVVYSGSIWPAFFLHAVLALSNEWLSLFHHPDITLMHKYK